MRVVCVRVCVRACVRVCVRLRACVRACVLLNIHVITLRACLPLTGLEAEAAAVHCVCLRVCLHASIVCVCVRARAWRAWKPKRRPYMGERSRRATSASTYNII